jgi:S-adenosylmethionine-dependent carboxyl methyltransferase
VVETSACTVPTAMEGHGAYNRNSRVQAAALSPAVSMFERAARLGTLPPEPHPIVIADYGCSQGQNSLVPVLAAINMLRERIGPHRQISVVHSDLPENDFTSLFQILITNPESYLRKDAAAFASAIGRSFYEQILPSWSVTLGWSSWAVQWLSRTPAPIPDQVQVALSEDAPTRAAFARQAAEDWEQFLVLRERELSPGGRLVVLTMAFDDNGDFGYRPLLNAMCSALEEMVDSGFLSPEELQRMAIPTVARSRADLLAPFGPNGRVNGLYVEEIEIFFGEDHIWLDFEQHRDALLFAAQWAAFSRASVFPTLASGLDGGRTSSRAADFMNRLETGVVTRLAAKPEPMLIPLGRLLIAKKT